MTDRLRHEVQNSMFDNPEQALARVDSAEQTRLFTAATANLVRANIYGNMDQTRLATFYGEQLR